MRSRALLGAVVLVTAAAGFLLATSPHPTAAAWQDPKAFGVTASAVTATAVPTVSCGAASGLLATAIPITWTAPAGTTPTRYRLVWSGSAGSGQAYFATSPGAVGGSLLSVIGTSTVTVYPEYGDWTTSPVSLQSRTITTIGALGIVVSWSCS
jgi:hypothetical protein